MKDFGEIAAFIFSGLLAISPLFLYFQQFKDNRSGKGESFSITIPFILSTASIIRIFYYFVQPFDNSLLLQSFIMVFVQSMLVYGLETGAQVNKKEPEVKFSVYCTYVLGLTTLLYLCKIFNIGQDLLETGTLVEAMLGVPQMWKNFNEGTKGLSPVLFYGWVLGDIVKTFNFIITASPFSFVLCGLLQVATDVVIILQIVMGKKDDTNSQKKLD